MCLSGSRYAFRGAAIGRVAPWQIVRYLFFSATVPAREKANKRKNTDGSVIFGSTIWRETAKNGVGISALVSSSA
jgi:hypothetical protein